MSPGEQDVDETGYCGDVSVGVLDLALAAGRGRWALPRAPGTTSWHLLVPPGEGAHVKL